MFIITTKPIPETNKSINYQSINLDDEAIKANHYRPRHQNINNRNGRSSESTTTNHRDWDPWPSLLAGDQYPPRSDPPPYSRYPYTWPSGSHLKTLALQYFPRQRQVAARKRGSIFVFFNYSSFISNFGFSPFTMFTFEI